MKVIKQFESSFEEKFRLEQWRKRQRGLFEIIGMILSIPLILFSLCYFVSCKITKRNWGDFKELRK